MEAKVKLLVPHSAKTCENCEPSAVMCQAFEKCAACREYKNSLTKMKTLFTLELGRLSGCDSDAHSVRLCQAGLEQSD